MAKKKRPEPPANRVYDVPLQIRITTEQHALFKRAAARDSRKVSDWARVRLEQAAKTEDEASR